MLTNYHPVLASCFSDESEREEPPTVDEEDQDLMSKAQKKAMEVSNACIIWGGKNVPEGNLTRRVMSAV